MKRPLGVTVTAVWMGILAVLFICFSLASGQLSAVVATVSGGALIGALVKGLWTGREWARKGFQVLLILGFVANLILFAIPGSKRRKHGPLYHGGKSVVMGLWAAYFSKSNVRRFFSQRTDGGI